MGRGAMKIDRDMTERLAALFARAGYIRVEPDILQLADAFLDLSGEDIRKRMFFTTDDGGREMCLRPEYTIPVCKDYLASQQAGQPVNLSYLGAVFRLRAGESNEFPQAGFESIGRNDYAAADAEIFTLTIEAVVTAGLPDPIIRCGDMGLTNALLDALGLQPGEKRRFQRALVAGRGSAFLEAYAESDAKANSENSYAGLLSALETQDPQAARRFVTDVLAVAGIAQGTGRSIEDIAERFLAKAARRDAGLGSEARAVLASYLNISGNPDDAASSVRMLTQEAGIDLDVALDRFEERNGFLALRGIDMRRMAFSGNFARNLDYYTGFVFDLRDPGRGDDKPVGGGGRYDALLSRLGSDKAIPAVGSSIWLDRLVAHGGRA
jgi:ATP phosphoribosyltransferase regulatory subunit